MARLVFAVHGLRSALNNTTALARLFIERGHDVTFVCFRDVRADVEHVGAQFVLLADGKHAADRIAALRDERGTLRSVRESRRARAKLLALEEPRRVLGELAPDLVIIDMELDGCVLAAHDLGLPSLLTLSWHDPKRAWKRPPMHRELAAPTGPLSAARVGLAWIQLVATRRLRQLGGPILPRAARARVLPQQLNTTDLGSIRSMARNLDIDLASITSRHEWINPHMYVHLPIMSYTVNELEFDRTSAAGVIHVGPIIDPNRYQRPLEARSVEKMTDFVDRFSQPGRRLAYCSMGSVLGGNLIYYQKVVDAFAGDPTWGLILGLGSRGADLELGAKVDNVLILADAPQIHILASSDVAIHPGGASTFYECQRFAVPSIVMHTGHTDMPGIAARIRHFGLGTVRDREQVTPNQIYLDATELAAGSRSGSLDKIKQVILDYETRSPAVDLVESLLQPQPQQPH